MNQIRHNSLSPIHCLRAFHILFFAYLLFRCYCYHHHKTPKKITFATVTFCYHYHSYHITLLLNTLLQILSYPGVVELTTQLLILANILWLPLRRINKFGLNTLPSKIVAIPYTCGLSSAPTQTHNDGWNGPPHWNCSYCGKWLPQLIKIFSESFNHVIHG